MPSTRHGQVHGAILFTSRYETQPLTRNGEARGPEAGGARSPLATIEVRYTLRGPGADSLWSLFGEEGAIHDDAHTLRIALAGREPQTLPSHNVEGLYHSFVEESVRRYQAGQPPLAGLEDVARALDGVKAQSAHTDLAVRQSHLYIYRTGLAQGISGKSYLVYEIEVGNGRGVREFVYVDAQSGAVVDQVSGIHEALTRRVYDGGYGPTFVVWNEGDPFPTADVDINNIITFTSDTYNMYLSTFGRDTHTGLGTSTLCSVAESAPVF